MLCCFFCCKNYDNEPSQVKRVIPKLTEIEVEIDNFEPANTNLYSWLFPFTTTPDGRGNRDRVMCFATEEELVEDTKKMMAKMPEIEGVNYVCKEMLFRLKNKIDFAKNDLIVAR